MSWLKKLTNSIFGKKEEEKKEEIKITSENNKLLIGKKTELEEYNKKKETSVKESISEQVDIKDKAPIKESISEQVDIKDEAPVKENISEQIDIKDEAPVKENISEQIDIKDETPVKESISEQIDIKDEALVKESISEQIDIKDEAPVKENISEQIDIKDETPVKENISEQIDIKDETPVKESISEQIDIKDETPVKENISEQIDIKDGTPVKENISEQIDIKDETPVKENISEQIDIKDEDKTKKSWFSKVVDTLNSPIEIKIENKDGDSSWLGKLKGNISIGLGEPVKKETSEEREKWKATLKERLSKTRQAFVDKLERLLHGRTKIDEDLLEEVEEILLESDVGVEMTDKIVSKLRQMAKDKRFLPEEVMPSLFDFLKDQLELEESRIIIDNEKLNIIMMVGVNGTGKTTTTGKIAAKLKISDYTVMMAAADTFRAAAIDQLDVWSKRAEVPLIKHQENSDAAAVVFDAIKAAKSRKMNVLLIDTAGRLHNKVNLMEELRKIRRIIDKEAPEAKLEVLLVLDGTTGQNGLKQAMVFAEAVKLTGVVLTKLDGTAKGGVIFSIRDSLNMPIKLVGVGEGIEDLRDFEPKIFIDALFSKKNESLIEESTKKVNG